MTSTLEEELLFSVQTELVCVTMHTISISTIQLVQLVQKIKIKKKTKTPRITDAGWNSQKRLFDPVEKKMKEGRKKRLLYLHPNSLFRFSSPIGSFTE